MPSVSIFKEKHHVFNRARLKRYLLDKLQLQ